MHRFVGEQRVAFLRKLLNLIALLLATAVAIGWGSGFLTTPQSLALLAGTMGLGVVQSLQERMGAELLNALVVGALVFTSIAGIRTYGLHAIPMANLCLVLLVAAYLLGRIGVMVMLVMALGMVTAGAFFPREGGTTSSVFEWIIVTCQLAVTGVALWWGLTAEEEARLAVRRNADALLEQESRYAELVRNAPDGVLALRLDGRVEAASPAVGKLTGYADPDMLGRRIWEMPWWTGPARERLRAGFRGLLAGREPTTLVLSFATRVDDPTLKARSTGLWFEARLRLVRRSDGALAVNVTLRDVSDRERAQQARQAYELRLQQAERVELLGRLAGGITHDFNNLLAVITANAELMSRRREFSSVEELHELLAAARLGAELTRKLMSLTRNQQVELEALDVGFVLNSLRPVLRSLLPTSIELTIDVAPDLPRLAAGHTHIEQIVVNLVVNARDAMPDGGALQIDVRPSPAPGGDSPRPGVRLAIRDTGTGIAPEHRALVFEPFFSTKGPAGTGLGLASTRGIVDQLGGQVALWSEVGRGSVFTVTLPAWDRGSVPVAEASGGQPVVDAKGGRVLLVEDGAEVRRATRRCLEHLGYDVVAVDSVDAALAECEVARPDVVLSDVVMPRRNGVDLMHSLRELHEPRIPVVLMSAHVAVDGASDADAFLQKPFTLDGIAVALEQGRRAAAD